MRVGIGYDVHRFDAARPLMLGGIAIPHARGLSGYSDADVLLHAIMDALLGAAGLPDIGHQFPNTDAAWKDASSLDLLCLVRDRLTERQWRVGNLDATVIAEAPKIAPYLPQMRAAVAGALRIAPDAVGIKATTNEQMGFVGREEGIAAMAVALLVPQ